MALEVEAPGEVRAPGDADTRGGGDGGALQAMLRGCDAEPESVAIQRQTVLGER